MPDVTAQAYLEAADTLAALIDKLPTLDVTWTPEIQADWFKAFDVLMEKVRGHLLAAAEQREQRDAALKLLNPVSPHETLLGAIRNLQQAHISERGNAEDAERQIATLTAERDDFRAEIGKLAGACTVLHANNAGLERERNEALARLKSCQDTHMTEDHQRARNVTKLVELLNEAETARDAFKAKFDRCFESHEVRLKERDEAQATLAQVREWEKSMPTYNFLTVAFAKLRLILNPPAPGAER